jgi:probable F420-dependent oxidoreductase
MSASDHLDVWVGLAFGEPAHAVTLAKTAEDAGYFGVMVSDHIAYPGDLRSEYPYTPDGKPMWQPDTPWPDPWVLIGGMAAVTQRLRFGTNIYIAPARNPFATAKAVATASVMSGGRVILGAGAGWMREEFELMGEDFDDRGPRFTELVQVLRTLWQGGMVEHHGDFYDFPQVQISPVPATPIPIYGGGQSGPALRRVVAHLDGWIGNYYGMDDACEWAEKLRGKLEEAGRGDDDFQLILSVLAPLSDENVERLVASGVTGVLVSPWFKPGGPDPTLEEKQQALERFAERNLS